MTNAISEHEADVVTGGQFQPSTHGLLTCLAAPCVVISSLGGDIQRTGAQGLFFDDVRYLSSLAIVVDDSGIEPAGHTLIGANRAVFQSVLRGPGDGRPEPSVWMVLDRQVSTLGMSQRMTVHNGANRTVRLRVRLQASADLASVNAVREGRDTETVPSTLLNDRTGVEWRAPTGEVARLVTTTPPDSISDGEFVWTLTIPAGSHTEVAVRLGITPGKPAPSPRPRTDELQADPLIESGDSRFSSLFTQSVADLGALISTTTAGDAYYAAGSPWYLTLFGRDSLWAARMTLPLGTSVAMGTLRALAQHQGTTSRADTGEQPGKILHELRRDDLPHALPSTFYGTADATCLWIILLSEAWRWGAPVTEIRNLIPALEAASDWLLHHSDSNGDGFLDYAAIEGIGEINQGWKDSPDSIHDAAGNLAGGPIALCELQGYGYQAAIAAAELLGAFAESESSGASRLRQLETFASELKERFRDRFWASGENGALFPSIAIDGRGERADALTSNIGHLLGTGLLSNDEEARVAALLTGPELLSQFGIRTLSQASPRYSPLSYHNGSVWPHDTAIALHGLRIHGDAEGAASVAQRLVAASGYFDGRLPELWGGESLPGNTAPLTFPTACSPQAWSAASAVTILRTILGLDVDARNRRIVVSPIRPMPFGTLSVRGLSIGAGLLDIEVDAHGNVVSARAPEGYQVEVVQ